MAKTISTNAVTKEDSVKKEESCGNGGAVESVEIQRQDFPSSHRSLEISQRTRDSHIPTAPATRPWKVENQKQVSHFPTAIYSQVKQNGRLRRRRKGDTSIEVRKGTFLTRLDTFAPRFLTSP